MPHLSPLRDLLSDPTHWTQRVEAKNSLGLQVLPNDPNATCWCLLGGIYKSLPHGRFHAIELLALAIDPESTDFDDTIAEWNDDPHRTHTQVLSLIDKVNHDSP